MAQLRQDYHLIKEKNAEVVIVGPDSTNAFRKYWGENNLPFFGLADPKHRVLKLFGQEVNIFKFGRMPAQTIIDIDGIVRYAHYGHEMSDIPATQEILEILEELNS